ncbi:MAG: adenylate/guanylate cyclase domain-containing protein [Magnetococcales bacterium]|nr:adenylate/guanylate cyclase domain-containing protein [Magnetococcales bacterium]
MSNQQFREKLDRAAVLADAPPDLSKILNDTILNLPPVKRVRLNPLTIANKLDADPIIMLDLFIQGARIGLFDWSWDLICPLCGFTTRPAAQSINDTPQDKFHCALCNIDAPTVMDDTIEVSFSPNPELLVGIEDHHVDKDTYLAYYASQASPFINSISKMIDENGKGSVRLEPGESRTIVFEPNQDKQYRLVCLDTHDSVTFEIDINAPESGLVVINQNISGFQKDDLPKQLPLKQTGLKLVNQAKHTVLNQLIEFTCQNADKFNEDPLGVSQERLKSFGPRVTGKLLLNNQTFRDHYGIQKLDPDLSLKIRDLTLLFTDLKGSTELYDRTGDIEAYRLVRDHFLVLKDVVHRHSGAIVKTMGDAIMATFSNPQDGVRASIDMLKGLAEYANSVKPHEIGLKIGLHSGPALTVNAGGHIDFFGQTVNIAARVQGLASAGEICVSENVEKGDGVHNLLLENQFIPNREEVTLKGVSEKNIIHRYAQN